jgi:sodium-dependent phosphate cotransporter
MLVSLAHMGDGEELESAFAGSAVLFFFNFMTVIILLPLEITTGYLFEFTKLMLPKNVGEGDSWEGPVKKMMSPVVKNIIIANKGLVDDISIGEVESCSSPGIYPTHCIGGAIRLALLRVIRREAVLSFSKTVHPFKTTWYRDGFACS